MPVRSFVYASVLVICGFAPCLAQQPTGPATLENLLNSDETSNPAVSKKADAGPKRPAGTVARSKDGVQHPNLDKAWAEYDAAVAKATESIKAAIAKQFDAATAKGDLDAAEKWQLIGEKFAKGSELPAETETKAAVSAAVADYKKAREELTKAYEAVVKVLTTEKKIAEAKAVRDESCSVSDASSNVKLREISGESQSKNGKKEEVVFLSDLPARDVSVGLGKLGVNGDMGFDDKHVVIDGVHLKKSVAMHPPAKGMSSAVFDVPVGKTHFEARVAINDGAFGHETPLVFKVYGDNRLLWASKPLKGPGRYQNCRVALKEVKKVMLTVECPGENWFAHAIWVDPKFLTK